MLDLRFQDGGFRGVPGGEGGGEGLAREERGERGAGSGGAYLETVAMTSCSWSPPMTETRALGHIHRKRGSYL